MSSKIIYCKDFKESKIRYANYVRNHINNVQEVYNLTEEAFKEVFPEVYADSVSTKVLYNNIKNHDKSKFNDNELYGYSAKFFPINGTDPESEEVKKVFKFLG